MKFLKRRAASLAVAAAQFAAIVPLTSVVAYAEVINLNQDSSKTATVTVSGTYTYTGSAITVPKDNVSVTYDSVTLNPSDFEIYSYDKNINAGTNTAIIYIEGKNDGTNGYSGRASGTFSIAKRTPTLSIGTLKAVAGQKLSTVSGLPSPWKFDISGGDPVLTSGNGQTFTATHAGNDNELPNTATVTVDVAVNKTAVPSISIDYINEKLKGFQRSADYSYTVAGVSIGLADLDKDGCIPIAGNIGQTIDIICKYGAYDPSDPQKLTIPARPKIPKIITTPLSNGTVKLLGDTTNLEYSINGGDWTKYTVGSVIGTNLQVDTPIQVRTAKSTSSFESAPDTIYPANIRTCSLELDNPLPQFTTVEYMYQRPIAQALVLKNTGNVDAYIKSMTFDQNLFTVSPSSGTIAAGVTNNASYRVAPITGLPVGNYSALLTITYYDPYTSPVSEKTITTSLNFVVEPKKLKITPSVSRVPQSDIGEDGYKVTFTSDAGKILKVEFYNRPSNFAKDSVKLGEDYVVFYPNAVVGEYEFQVVPVDRAQFAPGTIKINVVNSTYDPTVAKTSAQVTTKIDSTERNGVVVVDGVTLFTVAQISSASAKNLTLDVKINDKFSWKVNTAKLADKTAPLDLLLKEETIPNADAKDAVPGSYTKTMGFSFKEENLGTGASLVVNTGVKSTDDNPAFANLYKYNKKGELVFVSVVPADAKGNAVIPVEESGKYAIVVAHETKMIGDLDNTCGISARDALLALKVVIGGKANTKDNPKADFNGDKKVTAKDALDILKFTIGKT